MKIGSLEVKKITLKRLLLFLLAILIISGIYPGIRLFQNIREFYAYQCLMTLPRHQVNLDLINSTFSNRPEWITKKDEFGWTVVHWTTVWCRKQVIEVMLENGADINTRTSGGLTPLHLTMRLNYEEKSRELIEFLIDNGAGINIKDDFSWTPLHEAVVRGNKLGVQILVSKGADINMKNERGENALHTAVQCASSDIIKILADTEQVELNAKNNDGWTPLHFAAWSDRRDIAEILLESGAEINPKDNLNHTPLRTANRNGKTEMVELLSGYGGV
ncbi:MAG: ankyrin repeat domain-containing protein [Planctomycetota bacterium]|jgi:cytohesin